MAKSIYCVYWRWFDENNKELERRCVTHSWYLSFRKAKEEFEKQRHNLYSNYPDRREENSTPNIGWSKDDGTYELCAVNIHAKKEEQSHIRLVLASANLN